MVYLSMACGMAIVPGDEREDDLMCDKEVVGDTTDLTGHRYSRGCSLGIAPHPVDDWRLQRGRPAELQTQVTGEPGSSDDVHLLADTYVSAETISATPAFPLGGGGVRSSRLRSRGLMVAAVTEAFGCTSTVIAAASIT